MKQLFFSLFWLLGAVLFAQKSETQKPQTDSLQKKNLFLVAQNAGDSVVLRWAPADPIIWNSANARGYRVVRFSMLGASVVGLDTLAAALRHLPLEGWQRRVEKGDSSAAAAQLLYGKDEIALKKDEFNLQKALESSYELSNKYSFALFLADINPAIADGMGPRWVDRQVDTNFVYIYRVFSNPDTLGGQVFRSDTATEVVVARRIGPRPAMPFVQTKNLDHAARFEWDKRTLESQFTAYWFERSSDGGRTFQRVGRLPKVFFDGGATRLDDPNIISFTDSLPDNYRKWFYRIAGVSVFGQTSRWTPPLEVMGVDLTPPSIPTDVKTMHLGDRRVRLSWQPSGDLGELKGWIVGRSESLDGPFLSLHETMISAAETLFFG